MQGEAEALAGKPRPSLLLLQVRPSLEGEKEADSVVFQLSLPGGGEDQVQRPEQVGTRIRQAVSPVKLLSLIDLIASSVTLICAKAVSTGRLNLSLFGNI